MRPNLPWWLVRTPHALFLTSQYPERTGSRIAFYGYPCTVEGQSDISAQRVRTAYVATDVARWVDLDGRHCTITEPAHPVDIDAQRMAA